MKFKSTEGKQVFTSGKIIKFVSCEFDTDDKDEIKALQSSKGVTEVKQKRQKAE